MPDTMDSLQIEIVSDSQAAISGLDALTASLGRLKTATRGGVGLTAVSNQMKKLNSALVTLQSPGAKITELVAALKPLETIGKSNLNSTINALRKLPDISKQLTAMNIDKFAVQINRVVAALRPLATEMSKISAGFSTFPSRIQRIILQNERLATSNNRVTKSYGVMGTGINAVYGKLTIYYYALQQVARNMSDWIMESNAYVENLNLFTVAMGKYADEALKYAETVQAIMGIDMSQWIRNQGIFMQIASGFGVVADKAYTMSRGLTQISYDISSFFNIPIDQALLKVQSGISGELEPLRRLGYALDVATLQQIAYANGINKSVESMTQAQKSELRYIAIMKQSENVVGDMARTLITPANALRILNQQIVQLKRALGNMFIPILIEVIPWVQAFVVALTQAAQAIALFLGFELPKIDYSGLDSMAAGAGAAEDAMEGATGAAKELKKITAGFDELNILDFDAGKGKAGAGAGAGGGLGLDLEAYDYDFLGKRNEQMEKMKKFFKDLLPLVVGIGAGFATWKIATSVLNLLKGGAAATGLGALALGIGNVTRALYGMATGSAAAKSALMFLVGGSTALTIGAIAGTVALLAARFVDLYNNSESFRKGLQRIGEIAKIAFDKTSEIIKKIGEAIGEMIPESIKEKFAKFFEFMDTGWKDFGITALGIALLFIPGGQVFGVIILAFELITVAIRGLGLISEETWEKIKKTYSDSLDAIEKYFTDTYENHIKPWFSKERWEKLADDAVKGVQGKVNEGVNWWKQTVNSWWTANVAPWFTTVKWSTLANGAKQGIVNKWTETVTWWRGALASWWTSVISPYFSYSKWMNGISGVKDSIVATFKNALESARTVFNNFISWLNRNLTFSWSPIVVGGKVIAAGGSIRLATIPLIPRLFAEGGFPNAGELFVARENGAEMVGAIGNRTAVANNDQIVESVSQGVYSAVRSAMGSNSGDMTVVVKLGEDTIMERVIKNLNRQSRVNGQPVIVT